MTTLANAFDEKNRQCQGRQDFRPVVASGIQATRAGRHLPRRQFSQRPISLGRRAIRGRWPCGHTRSTCRAAGNRTVSASMSRMWRTT